MKDGIIIQARTGSTRLHNKICLLYTSCRLVTFVRAVELSTVN